MNRGEAMAIRATIKAVSIASCVLCAVLSPAIVCADEKHPAHQDAETAAEKPNRERQLLLSDVFSESVIKLVQQHDKSCADTLREATLDQKITPITFESVDRTRETWEMYGTNWRFGRCDFNVMIAKLPSYGGQVPAYGEVHFCGILTAKVNCDAYTGVVAVPFHFSDNGVRQIKPEPNLNAVFCSVEPARRAPDTNDRLLRDKPELRHQLEVVQAENTRLKLLLAEAILENDALKKARSPKR